MKLKGAVAAMASAFFSFTMCQAQHSDVEFGYDNTASPTAFVIEGNEFTFDGIQIFEAGMEEFDPFNPGDFGSDEPGFATNAAEGLLVNSGDQIFLRILDASVHSAYGVGFVNYYDPNTDSLEASASRRLMAMQNSASFDDLVINGTGFESGDNPVFIDFGDGTGNIHDHVFFDLLDDGTAPFGAYGLLVQLESDFASNGIGSTDLESAPFWMIWNHGMAENDFDSMALPKFGAVPEPSSLLLLGSLAMGTLGFRRRRR